MRSMRIRNLLILSLALLPLLGCNLPQSGGGQALPSPDLTLTAIYSVLLTPAPTQGDLPTQALPTVLPSATLPVPTAVAPTILAPTIVAPTATGVPPTPVMPTAIISTAVPASATPAPTNTPISYVGPAVRSGPKFVAYYFQREPTIDGVFDEAEWTMDRYPVDYLVYNTGHWSNADDLSGTVMFGWDDYFLYIAVRVKDNEYVQNTTGAKLYLGDSLEVLLDTQVSKDYYLPELSGDDFQLGISPGYAALNNSPEAYLWYPSKLAGSQQKVKIASIAADLGYRVEVKIPWELLGIDPDIGQHYGFAFSISDNDNVNREVQQSMTSIVSTRMLTDPTTWGDLELLGRKK